MKVIVIGAGIVGVSTALELRRAGREVIVVEREEGPGLGSTQHSSSVIRCHYTQRDAIVMALEGLRIGQDCKAYLGITRARASCRRG